MIGPKDKKERRVGERLFLKAERGASPKAGVIRHPVKPGFNPTKKGRARGISEYGLQLLEKQKTMWAYRLRNRQLKNYFKKALKSKEPTYQALAKMLEKRLDNIIYRAGYVSGRSIARQLVNHGHFLLNGKRTTIPSTQVKVGDVISIRPQSKDISHFKDLAQRLKKITSPTWLELNKDNFEVKMLREPDFQELQMPFDLNAVVEFYSR